MPSVRSGFLLLLCSLASGCGTEGWAFFCDAGSSSGELQGVCSGMDQEDHDDDEPEGVPSVIRVQDYWNRGVAGILIASHGANGRLLDEAVTGDDGIAPITRASRDGSISMYQVRQRPDQLVVETVLRAGTGPVNFIVDYGGPAPPLPEPAAFVVTATVPAGATGIRADRRCFAAMNPEGLVVELEDPCRQFDEESIFVTAIDATLGEWGWGLQEDIAKTPGETTQISIAATNTSYVDWMVTADFPAGAIADSEYASVTGFFTEDLVGGKTSSLVPPVSSVDGPAWTLRLPDAPFHAWASFVAASYAAGDLWGAKLVSAGADTDFSFAGLPFADVSSLESTDAERPVIRWTPPGASDADVGIAGSVWNLESGGNVNFRASFPLDDPAISKVRVPELPSSLAETWGEAPIASVDVTWVEYRDSSLIHSAADISADYYRGMGGMQTPPETTFLSSTSLAPMP